MCSSTMDHNKMKFFKTAAKYLKGHDLTTSKEKLAEDFRKAGNILLLVAFASAIFSNKTVSAIIGKLVGIEEAAELVVSHSWILYLGFGLGTVMRVSSFILDIKPKKASTTP